MPKPPSTPNRLRQLRKERGVKVTDLASSLGKDASTYVRYEQGNTAVPLPVVRQLAEFYDVTTEYLLGWDHEPIEDTAA